MSGSPDRDRVQRSALRVGILVAAGSALVITAGVAVLVLVLLISGRPEGEREPERGEPVGDHIVVDVDRVLPVVLALGVLGVVLLGVIAWLAARSAVRPLAEALRLQRAFVADSSHELRTPLTALTSRIQILQRRQAAGRPIEPTIAALRHDARVLDDVLTDMLLAAEGEDAGDSSAQLDGCLESAVATLEPLADETGVTLRTEVAHAMTAPIPSVTLTRLCVALIDNAVHHSPSGSVVTVAADRNGDTIEIRVTDAGSGVDPADHDRIFERFARAAESGRRRGFGLGLALVRETAARYGGTAKLESTSSTGSTFVLALPASR
ncbi:HAMP domain-containing sensor histidine kinase [Microbacterium sp. AZCO]|uniref:sensor histidine kinase n=1 Tax=Microbacterium sp. AZCO TaxID=3142976 RepID=UPI0031F3A48F